MRPVEFVRLHSAFWALVVMVLSSSALVGQRRPALRRNATAPFTAQAQQSAPTMGVPSLSPTAIPIAAPSVVLVSIEITDSRLLPTTVLLNRVDDNGHLIATVGTLHDDGLNGDAAAGDHVFSGQFTFTEATANSIRLRVSAAFRGFLQRVQTDVFDVNAQSGLSVLNADKDFWALNQGADGIAFNFADVPQNTTELKISRASLSGGPWTVVIDVSYSDDLPQPLLDPIDGTTAGYYYKLEAFDTNGALLKTYASLFVPQYQEEAGQSTGSISIKGGAIAAVAAPTPIYNTAWITDAIYENATAMTVYQIRDLLSDKGSFLATTTIEDTIPDTDGVAISPAKLISQMAATYSINPQLVLVSLQKESQSVTSSARPIEPHDGWMGAKSCGLTIREQLDCGTSRFRAYLTQLDTNGHTISGWAVGVPKTTSDHITVTPINRAVASLFTYTPWVGQAWGGQQGIGGTALNYAVWTPTLFGNIVHILNWKTCNGGCPEAPEVHNQGWLTNMGVEKRAESDQQAISRHGVSAGLPPNASYSVIFECSLYTWDSYDADTGGSTGYWDSFSISVTPNRYWLLDLTDPINNIAAYVYGGATYGDGILQQSGPIQKTVTISGNTSSVTYLNVMLDTATQPDVDTSYPSWGSCTVKKVKAATSLGIFAAPN